MATKSQTSQGCASCPTPAKFPRSLFEQSSSVNPWPEVVHGLGVCKSRGRVLRFKIQWRAFQTSAAHRFSAVYRAIGSRHARAFPGTHGAFMKLALKILL